MRLRGHWRERRGTDNCQLVGEQQQSRQEDSTAVPGPGERFLAQHYGLEGLPCAGGRWQTLSRRAGEKGVAGGYWPSSKSTA